MEKLQNVANELRDHKFVSSPWFAGSYGRMIPRVQLQQQYRLQTVNSSTDSSMTAGEKRTN